MLGITRTLLSVITAVEGYVAGDKNNEEGEKSTSFLNFVWQEKQLGKKKKLPAETNVLKKKCSESKNKKQQALFNNAGGRQTAARVQFIFICLTQNDHVTKCDDGERYSDVCMCVCLCAPFNLSHHKPSPEA